MNIITIKFSKKGKPIVIFLEGETKILNLEDVAKQCADRLTKEFDKYMKSTNKPLTPKGKEKYYITMLVLIEEKLKSKCKGGKI